MRKGFCNFVSWLCVLSLVFFIGCDGGGGDDDESSESTAAAVPTWTGSFHMTNPDGQQETINLEQNNNDITGSTTLGGTATGTANGSNAEITINYPDSYVIILNLTINITIINGTFSDSEGREGTVEATKDGGSNSSSSSSTSVSGTWNWVITHTEDANAATVTFTQSGTSITGEGIGLPSGEPFTCSGTIVNNRITWRVVYRDDPNYIVDGTGIVDGNSMSGTYIAHDGNTGTWSGTRQ